MPQIAKAATADINGANFPDEISREYVSNEIDKDKNEQLSDVEITKVKDIIITGFVTDQTKTMDCTYTATVIPKYDYITVTSVQGSTDQFETSARGLKNNKNTKVSVIFKCDQNNKKNSFSLTITK